MCVSHMPAPACCPEGCLTFHSTTIAPAANDKNWFRDPANACIAHTRTDCGKEHVCNLDQSLRVGVANLDHGTRIIEVRELAASSCNDRPCLTDDLGSSGNGKGRSDDVGARIEEDDLASSELNKAGPQPK